MSVQLVKWFILVFAVCSVIMVTCQIFTTINTSVRPEYTSEYMNRSNTISYSFTPSFYWNTTDIGQRMTHISVKKKIFTCLLVHLNYHLSIFQNIIKTYLLPICFRMLFPARPGILFTPYTGSLYNPDI